MATQKTASFGDLTGTMIAPDLAAEQLQLQRRQQIADYLRKEALTPIDQQTITGSGPTRVVPISPVQGLAKMLTAYMGKKNQDEIDQRSVGINQQMAQRMASILNPDAPPTPPQPSAPQSAPDTPPPQGAPSAPQDPQAAPPQAPQGQPPQMSQGPAQNNFGLANLLRGSVVGQLGGDQAGAAYWKQYDPTDATRLATAAGTDPRAANLAALLKANTDPKILAMRQAGMSEKDILGAVYGEAAKNAEIERKAGNQFVNPMTGASGQVPHMPPNANPVGPIASNGAITQGVAPMPNAAGIVQNNAQTAARGGAVGGFHSIQTPSGGTQVVPGEQIAPGSVTIPPNNAQTNPDLSTIYGEEMKKAQARLAAATTPEETQRAQNDIAGLSRESARVGIPQGQGTGAKVVAENSGAYMKAAPQEITALKQTVNGLENAYSAVERLGKSGPGMNRMVDVKAVLENLNLPVDKEGVKNFQTLKKFLANSANTAAGANGSNGSDARLDQFLAGQPNAEKMNADALKGAIRYVLSQHDSGIAERQFVLSQSGGDPSKVQAAREAWTKVYDPKVFEFSRMTPADQKAFKANLLQSNPAKAKLFGDTYNSFHQQGWVQ